MTPTANTRDPVDFAALLTGAVRALAFALARSLWNALPLPRLGFVPEPVPEPGRNERCPCGSGEKYKRCCAGAALKRAHRHTPRVARFLLPARVRRQKLSAVGVSLDGDDRAWVYRDAMRALWQRSPGAMEWTAKVLEPGAIRG